MYNYFATGLPAISLPIGRVGRGSSDILSCAKGFGEIERPDNYRETRSSVSALGGERGVAIILLKIKEFINIIKKK